MANAESTWLHGVRSRQIDVYAGLILVQLFFGTFPVAGKIVLGHFSPWAMMGLRMTATSVILFVLSWVLGVLSLPTLRQLGYVVLCSFFGIVLNQALFLHGLARTTASNAAILMVQIPVFTFSAAVLLRMERLTGRRLLGLLCGLAGVLVLLKVETFSFVAEHQFGNLLILFNTMSYTVYLLVSKKVLPQMNPLNFVTWFIFIGAVMIQPLSLKPMLEEVVLEADLKVWLALGWIILMITVVNYFLNAYALQNIAASIVAAFVYLQTVVGIGLAIVMLDERLSLRTALAALLVFSGVYLVTLQSSSSKKKR